MALERVIRATTTPCNEKKAGLFRLPECVRTVERYRNAWRGMARIMDQYHTADPVLENRGHIHLPALERSLSRNEYNNVIRIARRSWLRYGIPDT